MPKLTKALLWLRFYRDGMQNEQPYPVNSVWTRLKGTTHANLQAAKALGFIVSEPDASINPCGWRHDITPAGRAALAKAGEES